MPASYRLTGTTLDEGADGSVEATYPGQPSPIELLEGDSARVTFYDQALATIRVRKTEVVDGVSNAGAGWTFTLSGCGMSEVAVTGASGEAEWTVPVREDCLYQVEETAQAGWMVTPATRIRTAQPLVGETVVVAFENSRTTTVDDTPTPTATAKPVCTPTPIPPASTPATPAETETPVPPTATPTSPPATATATSTPALAPATVPPCAKTPIPPGTGSGGTGGGTADRAVGGLAAGALLGLLSMGILVASRRFRARH